MGVWEIKVALMQMWQLFLLALYLDAVLHHTHSSTHSTLAVHECRNSFTVLIIRNCSRLFCLRFSWLKIVFLCSVFWGWVGGGCCCFGGGESVEQKQNVYQSFKKKKKKFCLPTWKFTMWCIPCQYAQCVVMVCAVPSHAHKSITLWGISLCGLS